MPAPALAETPSPALRLAFVPYAAAFSLETKQSEIVDPLVFVIAPHAPPATGLLGISHFPGIRNAFMSDDPMQPALDANGKPLGFDLQHWFAATGIAEFAEDASGRDRVTARFTNLVPNGRYSLFATRSDGRSGALPLDGNGRANSFTAAPDGTGGIALVSAAPLTHGNVILLVFHSDRADHGQQRGEIGIYAHVQLAAPIP
ncbi:MAG: hypothetical protein IAI49_02860 [Candidatus Eremiobacteraeota bacterium]|nr:hypothetical protein [Candidatus Eremiobacteraeota bacterium]